MISKLVTLIPCIAKFLSTFFTLGIIKLEDPELYFITKLSKPSKRLMSMVSNANPSNSILYKVAVTGKVILVKLVLFLTIRSFKLIFAERSKLVIGLL